MIMSSRRGGPRLPAWGRMPWRETGAGGGNGRPQGGAGEVDKGDARDRDGAAERPDTRVEAEDVSRREEEGAAYSLGQLAGLLHHGEQPWQHLAQHGGQPGAQQPPAR